MIWLGRERGYATDWATQRWVQFTGRKIEAGDHPWLAGPSAPPTGIDSSFFETWAATHGLTMRDGTGTRGILPDFSALRGATLQPEKVSPAVVAFYEQTSDFELDVWAEWRGCFRPFGRLLAWLFSRRLQQLNVPLSSLDTSRGMTNEVLQFCEPHTHELRQTAWLRRLRGSGHVIYAGFYSICRLPNHPDPCVKVVFPLPSGNAIVFMRTRCLADGSFELISSGEAFGDPGFYFTVHHRSGSSSARYLRSMRETIHVYPAENGSVRTDHRLRLWGMTFLDLHYRMQRTPASASSLPPRT